MNESSIIDQFLRIKTNRARAPHKPLLLLWAIGQCLQGKERLFRFKVMEENLRLLMVEFGTAKQLERTDFARDPFWLLKETDGLFDVEHKGMLQLMKNTRPSRQSLIDQHAQGGFTEHLYNELKLNHRMAICIANLLIDKHFCEQLRLPILMSTLGEKVLTPASAVSLLYQIKEDLSPLIKSILWRRARFPKFRLDVLKHYNYRCAVCDYTFKIHNQTYPGLEAAHIQWHSHDGPDEINNSLALCSIHHELFDRGIFTVMPQSHTIIFSEEACVENTNSPITSLHQAELNSLPDDVANHPSHEFLNWHHENVFCDARVP